MTKELKLRAPDDIAARLKAAADLDGRSVNNYLVRLLDRELPQLPADEQPDDAK